LAAYDDVSDDADDAGSIRVASADDAERYLSFVLAGEAYAASIMDVREILKIRSLTDVPRAPRGVLGVISKRGMVLPVVDLATALGLRTPDRRLRVSQRVLVVGDGDRACGLRVDAVSEVIKLQTNAIEGVPASVGIKNAGLLSGLGRIEGVMYILLDLGAVLDSFAASVGLAPASSSALSSASSSVLR
jgi:purine-binding chemotaxis protein CheW